MTRGVPGEVIVRTHSLQGWHFPQAVPATLPAPGLAGLERWVSGADPSASANDDTQALAALRDALGPFGACRPRGLAEAAILLCAFPQWAVWLPADRGGWTAMRPADSMSPGPETPMVWVQAGTAGELAGLMQAADARSSPGED